MAKTQDYMSWLRFGKNWRNYKVILRNLLQNPSLSARRGDILPVVRHIMVSLGFHLQILIITSVREINDQETAFAVEENA